MNNQKAIEILKDRAKSIKSGRDYFDRYENDEWADKTKAELDEEVQALDHAINCVGAIDQIKWERDIAIQQLNELGLDLGQKTDKVKRAIQHFNNLKKIVKGSDEE